MKRTVTLFAACIVLFSVFAHDLVLSPPLVFAGQISLQITDVTAPAKVVAGERLTANVSVKWSGFDRNARTILDEWGNTINVQPPVSYGIIVSIVPFGSIEALSSVTDMNVKTSGSKSYGLMLTAPRFAGPWALTARVGLRIRMEATNNTITFMNQHSKDVTVDVAPAATTTSATVPRTTTATQPTTQVTVMTTAIPTETPPGAVVMPSSSLLSGAFAAAIIVVVGIALFAFRRRAAKATRN